MLSGSVRPSRRMAEPSVWLELARSAGLDARGGVARIVASEAGAPQRTEQIAQSTIAEEVQPLVGDLKLQRPVLVGGHAARDAGHARRLVRGRDGDVAFLLHALDQLIDQLVHAALLLHTAQCLPRQFVELRGVKQCVANGLSQSFQRIPGVGGLEVGAQIVFEAALQQKIAERVHQVFQAQLLDQVRCVLAVADALHGYSRCSILARFGRGRASCFPTFAKGGQMWATLHLS